MEITQVKHAYFIGIGGIGMSAIARYFKDQSVQVSGYDRTSTALTKTLHTCDPRITRGVSVLTQYRDPSDEEVRGTRIDQSVV